MSGSLSPEVSTDQLRKTFDRVAMSFDSVLTKNAVNRWMHDVNMTALVSTFHPGDHLLELGCGTGTAAVELARRGCKVLGLDISDRMVAKAQEKVALEHLADKVVIARGRSRDISSVVRQSPWKPFDGAYANFALTYEEDLAGIAGSLAGVLKLGAPLVCTLPNRVVLSEAAIYGCQLRFRKVLWRLAPPLFRDVEGSKLEFRAYSPWQVRDAFRNHFRLQGLIGLPTFLPPAYLHSQYSKLGAARGLLQSIERHLATRYPWNRLGEHTLFEFRRT